MTASILLILAKEPDEGDPPLNDEGGASDDDSESQIYVRIVSPRFAAQAVVDRQDHVWGQLRTHLRGDLLTRVFLILETPAEAAGLVAPNVGTAPRYPEPFVVVQGGGAKGGWQGAVLYELLSLPVQPVAAVGSSAGAINSWLMSAKLREDSDNPFDEFWTSIPLLMPLLLPVLVALGVIFLLRVSVQRVRRAMPKDRRTAIIPFEVFANVFWSLLPRSRAAIHTYMYAANVDEPEVPPVFDSQTPFRFWFAPGTADGELVDRSDVTIPYWRAVAASACLPFIEPLTMSGVHYADGGLYSNLPANSAKEHGALGGDCIVCVLAKPLDTLDPAGDCIDYRTAVLLELLLEQQAATRRRRPIYVVQPDGVLKSGLWRGFVDPFALSEDIARGHEAGRALASAVRKLVEGDERALAEYELTPANAPAVPAEAPPHRKKWVLWVNRRWFGQGAGARMMQYPIVDTVSARRRGIGRTVAGRWPRVSGH